MLRFTVEATETKLVSLELVKAELDISGSDSDAALTARIEEVSAEISGECNRENFGAATAEERLSVRCGSKWPLWLRHWPVTSIVGVSEDGTALAAEDYLLGEKRQLLRRSAETGHLIPWRGSRIVVTYEGGYDLPDGCPADLRRAALTLIRGAWAGRKRDPAMRTYSVPGVIDMGFALPGAMGGLQGAYPADVAAALNRYRNVNAG
jgi:hypothetical protein